MIPMFNDLPETLSEAVSVLHAVDGWPQDWGKDSELVRRLSRQYPKIELLVSVAMTGESMRGGG